MALVTLTDLYSSFDNWPGDLLAASDGVTIGSHTATTFAYTFNAGTQYAGYSVTSTGTGFAYDSSTPTSGTMTGLTIRDPGGHVVLSVTGIAGSSGASDLALFAAYEFGWSDPGGGGSGAQVKNAWSLLLSGNDTIIGTAGNDRNGLAGVDAGDDVFNMNAGDDRINGGMGNDTIDGGDGWDWLTYDQTHWNEGIPMVRGISVNVTKGTVADPYGFTDHFTGIEEIHGSALADKFTGGASGMYFEGLRGADRFTAGSTADDWVIYRDDTWLGGNRGISVHLQVSMTGTDINGTIRDGFGALDRTVNIANVEGTRYSDTFVGSSADNTFAGGEGKDRYEGGGGIDTIWFFRQFGDATQAGIDVDMTLTSGQIKNDGFGHAETAISIEKIVGTWLDDRIKGSAGADSLEGLHGNDTLSGAGGKDTFIFFHDFALNNDVVIKDFHAGSGANQDVLLFGMSAMGLSTTLHLVNGTSATLAEGTFLFDPATHVLSWDADGTGSGTAENVATLNGVAALSSANFDLV